MAPTLDLRVQRLIWNPPELRLGSAISSVLSSPGDVCLGRVDGFNQHQSACKTDDGGVADVGLFASHGDALEPLDLADRLFDTRPEFI